jgi:hypothetical protein
MEREGKISIREGRRGEKTRGEDMDRREEDKR